MGTPRYMPAEQHLGESVDARADQYSFCAALFEALFATPPFDAESYPALVAMVVGGTIARPKHADVPPKIIDSIMCGLSRRRDDRFATMHELIAALAIEPVSAPAPPPRTSQS